MGNKIKQILYALGMTRINTDMMVVQHVTLVGDEVCHLLLEHIWNQIQQELNCRADNLESNIKHGNLSYGDNKSVLKVSRSRHTCVGTRASCSDCTLAETGLTAGTDTRRFLISDTDIERPRSLLKRTRPNCCAALKRIRPAMTANVITETHALLRCYFWRDTTFSYQ